MSVKSQLVIVSAFGRSHWLAAELAHRGYDVSLVDVSHHLGRWAPEDREGPFGIFFSERLSLLQKERLVADEVISEQKEGLTFWLKDRPVELMGPLAKYQLDSQGVSSQARNYLFEYDSSSEQDREALKSQILRGEFKDHWLAHFSHQWSANRLSDFNLGFLTEEPLPVFSKMVLRQATRRGMEQSLAWCESKGVRVYRQANLEDLYIDKKKLEGIEIQSDHKGLLKGEEFIWSLSSEETMVLNERLGKTFFPAGDIKPEWSWVRYRVKFIRGQGHLSLPDHVVAIENLFLPWTHENLLILQRTVLEDETDIWLRIPNNQRTHHSYLKQMGQKILSLLRQRLRDSDVEIAHYPQELNYSYAELGPRSFPVYGVKDLQSLKRKELRNLHYAGPESWDRLDAQGILDYQEKLLNDIEQNHRPQQLGESLK